MYITKQKVTMNSNVIAGLMVTSGSSLVLNTATYDNLLISYNGGTAAKSGELMETTGEEIHQTADKFAMYPNPSKGTLMVRLPATAIDQKISVFDINGREVLSQTITNGYKQLNLAHLSNGLYYIRYKEGTKVRYEKFIINK